MADKQKQLSAASAHFPDRVHCLALFYYLLSLIPLGGFLCCQDEGEGAAKWIFLIATFLASPVVYQLPACIALACTRVVKKPGLKRGLVWFAAFFCASVELVLLVDFQIFRQFGFHINGLVINLLFTRGGFESMGLGLGDILLGILLILALYSLYFFLAGYCIWGRFPAVLGRRLFSKAGCWISSVLLVLCFLVSLFSTGLGDFYSDSDIQTNQELFPYVVTMRIRTLMRRLGCKEPSRKEIMLDSRKNRNVNYPVNPICRNPERQKYNIIWLVGESMRWDLLTPEVMPNTWALAQKGLRCTNYYSGGNGTRTAMFSMFYGLYGQNWNNFLSSREPPILFRWLQEDGYRFLCQTSAKFTYPEFDKTIFSSMEQSDLIELSSIGAPPVRDEKLVDQLIAFVEQGKNTGSFFAFGFFESTHAPYSFPKETALYPDYMQNIHYATVTQKDAKLLKNRYLNSAHYVDLQIGRILQYLETVPEIRDNTIVIITGDHGEEFFEKGRLGHNSTFVEEQVRPLFMMFVPGREPKVVEHLAQSTDLIATLAPLLGVKNPASDFSVGQDLYSPDYNRDQYLICGWDIASFLSPNHKAILPLGRKGGIFSRNITERDDSPCRDPKIADDFFSHYAPQIMEIQKELARFTDK